MNAFEKNDSRRPGSRRVLVMGRKGAAGEATERYLEYCGHEVARAGDPDSAVARAETLEPQVLVCDINVDSGSERIRAARQIQAEHQSALVIITNYRCGEIRNRFPELNVAGCLRKPLSLETLANAVSASESG